MSRVRKVGVEEELLLVDPDTGELANASGHVLHKHRNDRHDRERPAAQELEGELLRHMVETHTDPSADLSRIRHELQVSRRTALEAADGSGLGLVAVGIPPLDSSEPAVTPAPRYERIVHEFGEIGRRAGTLGMHVHVDIADDAEGVRVIDGLRPWIPLLVAVAANSPYADGRDTGYASWRYQLWGRWPSAGTMDPFGSVAEYRRVSQALIDSGAALDPGMLYFDARLAEQYPTLEVRVADTCTEIDDALVVVALARALVESLAHDEDPGVPPRTDVLRAATWRASRDGLAGDLVHPESGELVPAFDAVQVLVDRVATALDDAGDTGLVSDGLERLRAVGNGARRQRAVYERSGELRQVVSDLLARTRASAG